MEIKNVYMGRALGITAGITVMVLLMAGVVGAVEQPLRRQRYGCGEKTPPAKFSLLNYVSDKIDSLLKTLVNLIKSVP